MEHKISVAPGVPGVYDILTCERCGYSQRFSPADVLFGEYLPKGNVLAVFKDVPCSGALVHPPSDMLPAYRELFTIYKETDRLRKLIPQCPWGHWPKIAVGVWGTPRINLWDRWYIALDQDAPAIIRRPVDSQDTHYRVRVKKDGSMVGWGREGFVSLSHPELEGWEQFKELALIMYQLPEPALNRKWFGRPLPLDLFDIFGACRRAAGAAEFEPDGKE